MQVSKVELGLLSFAALVAALSGCASHKNNSGAHSDVMSSMGAANPFHDVEVGGPAEWAEKNKLPNFRLFFAGNVNGQLEPCGCAVNPKGGLDRRLNFIRQETKLGSKSLVVDAGNALFPAKTLDAGQAEFQKKRAQAVLKGHRLMGVMAQNVGYLDFAAGSDFLKKISAEHHTPLVSTNLVDAKGQPLFATERKVELSPGLKVTILGVSAGGDPVPHSVKVLDPLVAIKAKLLEIPLEEPVVILSDLGNGKDRELGQHLDRPVIIVGGRDLSSLEIPGHEAKSLIVQSQLQGQQWGVIDIAWNAKAAGFYNRKIASNFEERWPSIEGSWKEQRLDSSAESVVQRERMERSAKELLAYAPGNLDQKIVYNYKLVDMTAEYLKTNELTPVVKQLKQKK